VIAVADTVSGRWARIAALALSKKTNFEGVSERVSRILVVIAVADTSERSLGPLRFARSFEVD
jgi:hypothetical protein